MSVHKMHRSVSLFLFILGLIFLVNSKSNNITGAAIGVGEGVLLFNGILSLILVTSAGFIFIRGEKHKQN